MKSLLRMIWIVHGLMSALFACTAIMLIVIAARVAGLAVLGGLDWSAAQTIIEDMSLLAAVAVAWDIFIRLNRYVEELEPEAMAEAKREDRKFR